jgi:hypothetical protein
MKAKTLRPQVPIHSTVLSPASIKAAAKLHQFGCAQTGDRTTRIPPVYAGTGSIITCATVLVKTKAWSFSNKQKRHLKAAFLFNGDAKSRPGRLRILQIQFDFRVLFGISQICIEHFLAGQLPQLLRVTRPFRIINCPAFLDGIYSNQHVTILRQLRSDILGQPG